ncbi:MAG: N-formylglutamate amidohydrolase [Rhodospirillaceae bacterium]
MTLLLTGDPPPFELINSAGGAPLLLVCDHASRAFPARLGQLGLADEVLDRHIAYDIGAAEVTRRLAALINAPALLAGYSRLVIDLNRGAERPDLIPEASDGVIIPGNLNLEETARAERLSALYRPWHHTVTAELQRLTERHGKPPVLIGIHSFTPVMNGQERPWHIGVLWDGDCALARPLMATLANGGELCVGDNEPYTARNPSGGTLETHALDTGLFGVSIEIRQDLISDIDGCAAWAVLVANAIEFGVTHV